VIAHMKENGWKVPNEDSININDLKIE